MPIAFPQIPRGRPGIQAKNLYLDPLIVQVNPNLPNPNFKFTRNSLDGGPGKIYPQANPAALKISIGKRFAIDNLDQFFTYDAKLSKRKEGILNTVLTGVSRDSTGAALGSCVIKLFRSVDDVLIAQTISDGSGNYSFTLPPSGPYYIVEYKAGAPDVTGASLNTLMPVPV